MKTSDEIRSEFLKFFSEKNHNIIPSDSLIPSTDPTLLFTSAGMVQFKKFFLGEEKMSPPRAASCQKCFRTSDIEKIGYTGLHLSFFEMLGNFSFGDYFKEKAIEWGWEFLTKNLSISKTKLYATVYKEDNEAYNIWKKFLPESKIYKLSEKTNFWNMGETGPCGPCSEIVYDLGAEFSCRKPNCNPECDCGRWIEVWNLVFTQFNKEKTGKLIPLPKKNIDTGMGLERLVAVESNKSSVFETDLFLPIIDELVEILNCRKYTEDKSTDIILRIIADHSRAITFLINDGILPGNDGRGYVLRRIIRRAVRQAKLLGCREPFLYRVTTKVAELLKNTYPELSLRRENIAIITKTEEEKFIETLDTGMNILQGLVRKAITSKSKVISGKDIFYLYDTYGFPPELTKEILSEQKLTYNEAEFIDAQKKAQEIAKASWRGIMVNDIEIYKKFPSTTFVGYEQLTAEAEITGIIVENEQKEAQELNKGETGEIILNITPFYAESGGQVGDTGKLRIKMTQPAAEGGLKETKLKIESEAEVVDTQKPVEDVIVHKVKVIKGKFIVGDKVIAEVDISRRKNITRHHTATHLLHKALRTVLGEHATQSGSLVAPDYFRFDFTHFESLEETELKKLEELVNEKIMSCIPVNSIITNIKQAKEYKAMALFGEKYKDTVRCVYIGTSPETAFSVELCGGTHCSNTGEIGLFKILREYSIGSGLRRIEAVCGSVAFDYLTKLNTILDEISNKLKVSKKEEISTKIDSILKYQKSIEKQLEELKVHPTLRNKPTEIEYELRGGDPVRNSKELEELLFFKIKSLNS
ncbi:MAG: alanine--tRNA ligase [Elusimicrobiota bacterium]|nr:alanine--tRNA ligase [Elusimicrobiota bacterium]